MHICISQPQWVINMTNYNLACEKIHINLYFRASGLTRAWLCTKVYYYLVIRIFRKHYSLALSLGQLTKMQSSIPFEQVMHIHLGQYIQMKKWLYFDSIWPNGDVIWHLGPKEVNTGSGNGMLPDVTKPLSELASVRYCVIHLKTIAMEMPWKVPYWPLKCIWKLHVSNQNHNEHSLYNMKTLSQK